ncbi:titin-like isoform X6 [Larimichthys crocea]|uniref:titin-like isoform X6 n=1 Tax=Larimichthys crocea TaxID=215358 RepID=UPI000F5EABAA|nr:titin-like isoform X6 [Larimichthys crocea]
MVMEREKVEEKPKMYRKDEEETVGEPDEVSEISSDISVTDGLKTEGLKTKVTAKTEEKVMTRSESKRKKVVSFKREPSKQKSQDKEFSVQITDSPETNEEIKDAKQDTKEHKERKAGSPEISVRTVSDQKQVIEPKQVTEGFSTPAQISRDKPKISERKPELKDSRPLEKASLQKKLKQTDQEQKPLNTENIETTPKKQETDSSELVKSIEKVESLKAEEKLCAGPKTPKLDIDVELDNFESRADTIKDMKQGQRRKERKDSVKPVTLLNKESSPEKLPSSELLPESILSEVVTLKGKLVKVSPMEGTTEMKPDREIVVTPSVEVKCPESLSERETITDSTLQKPETLSKARTLKDVAQKVRQQTVVEDEDLFKTTIVKDKHVKIHPKEKAKPRQEQTEKSGQDGVPKQIPEQYYTESEDSGNNVTSMEGKYYKVTLTEETKPELRQTQRKSPVTEVEEIKQIEEILIPECTSKRLDEDKTDTTEQQKKPTRKKQVGRKPSEIDKIDSESVAPQEPQQKSQVVIVEQDQQRVSTVKDKTFKVTPLKELKSEQEQIERKGSVTSMMEETSKKLEEVPQKLEFVAVDEEMNTPEGMPSQESISLQKKEQKSSKTKKAADKQIPLSVKVKDKTKKVTPIQDGAPEKHAKTEEIVTEPATFDDETDTIDSESISPPQPQQKLTKPQEIIVEQGKLRVSTVKDKTFKVTALKETKSKQEDIERKVSVMEETSEELEEAQEKLEFEAVDDEIHVSEGIPPKELISLQKKEQKTTKTEEAADKQIPPPVTVKDKTKKVTPIQDGALKKHAKTEEFVTEPATFDDETDTIDSESVSPQQPQQKLTKPQEIIVEQDKLRVSTVKDKTFKVTPLKESKSKQEHIERKVSVMEETSEELEEAQEKLEIEAVDEIHVSESIPPKELISLQKKEKTKTKETADKQISPSVKVKDKTKKVTPIKDGTPDKDGKTKEFVTEPATFDEETDTTEIESVSPQQKLTKPQEIIVEQDKLRLSTVKDKTFKVTPLKESKSKQEHIERKVSVTPMIEETSEELEEAQEKLEFEAVDDEIHVSEGIPPKELISLQKKEQKTTKTEEAADKQIPPPVTVKDKTKKVTPIQDGALKKHAKTEEFVTEPATFDDETDTIDSESVSPQQPQQKLTKPQEIIVEQDKLGVSTVKDKTFKVTPLKESKSKQEHIERKVSVTPMIEETFEELEEAQEKLQFEAVDEINMPEGMPSQELISLQKKEQKTTQTKEAADKQIPPPVTVKDKTKKVTPIKDATPEKHAKTKEFVTEPATFDDETDTIDSESVSPQQKLTKPQEIIVEQDKLRVSTVKDKTFKVTPLKESKSKQEDIERKISVTPMIEETSEEEELKVAPEKLKFVAAEETSNQMEKLISPQEQHKLNKSQLKQKSELTKRGIEKGQFETIHSEKKEEKSENIADKIQSKGDRKNVKPAKFAPLEERQTMQEQTETKAAIIPEIDLKQKKAEEDIQSETVTVKDEYGQFTLFEETKQVKRVTAAPVMEVATEKSQVVEDGGVISDTLKHITVEQAKTKENIIKDIPEKIEVERKVSGAPKPEVSHEDTSEKLEIMYKTTTVPPVEEMKTELTKTVVSPTTKVTKRDIQREKDVLKMIDESEHISQIKEATQTEVEQKIEKTSELLTEDIKTKKSKSIKDKKTLPKSTKTTLEEVQSRTVVVKDIFGTVTPFEVTETKPEQIETKFSMAPVMEVASQRSLIVKDGDVKSDTLQMYVTPDELVRDIASRKEDIYESDEISVKTKDTKDTGVEQVQSKVDRVQDKTEKMTPIEEKLPEKQEQIERKASVASKPEVTDQHSLVDTEEFKTKQRQTETKTFVTPVKEVTDTEIKEIQSKKSKSLKDKGQRVDKGTKTSLEEVQSKTIMFKDEYGTVTPFGVTETKQEEVKRTVSIAPVMEIASEKHFIVKDGDVKSDTLQRFIVPDKLVKDITSKKEDIRESRDDSLRLSQGSETAKESAGMSQVRSEFKTDDAIQTKQKQTNQEAERTAVAHQKALVGEHAKTEIALKDHSLRHEEIKYDNTSPKKLDFKYQEQATAESIQSRTDTVKDVFLSVTPEIETKQEQIDRKASRTPVMDVAYETPLTVKQQDNILDTSRRYMSPDDLVKDTTSRKKVAYESDDISLKTDKFTTDTTPKEMLIEQDALERQLGLTKPKKIKTETTIVKDKIIKEFHDKEKTDIKTTVEEQIKGKDLGIPTKRSGEIEIINEEIKSYKPTIKESKADIEWQEPTAREPSVTDKTKRKIIEKKTTMDYKTASPEYREGATRKPEVEPFLKVDVQYVPPHEVETISRKKGEAQELETRVLSVEPDGKQLVSPQESFRGIEGKMLHVTEHRVFLI